MSESKEKQPLLKIDELHVSFLTYAGKVQAVRGVSLSMQEGEILAIVGESGCGKSVTAQTILQLNPSPPSVVEGGSIKLEGRDLLQLDDAKIRAIRGHEISMIFQDPMTSLNPTMRIGKQIMEAILKHQKVTKKEAYDRAVEMLRLVGLSNPEQRMKQYPFEFSGGMRQRAMIAVALVCRPKILIRALRLRHEDRPRADAGDHRRGRPRGALLALPRVCAQGRQPLHRGEGGLNPCCWRSKT